MSSTDAVVLAGGVSKRVLATGLGEVPPDGVEVAVNYVGRFEDGKTFDASARPFRFKVGRGQVIKGWDRAIMTMKPGEKAEIVCPPEMAYGKRGCPPLIGPDTTLIFEVELVEWNDRRKVVDDGGVVKIVKQHGDNILRPNDGARVCLTYVASFASSGEVFERREEPFEMIVGGDPEVPEGLELGIKNMSTGERSVFTVKPDYAFAEHGLKAKGIPADATLQYDVTLIRFTKGLEGWELSADDKIDLMRHRKQQANTYFKANQVRRAFKRYQDTVNMFRYDAHLSSDQKQRADAVKVDCLNNMSVVCLKQQEHRQAVAFATESLALCPGPANVKALAKRGQALYQLRRFEDAIQDLKKALVACPGHADAARYLAAAEKEVVTT